MTMCGPSASALWPHSHHSFSLAPSHPHNGTVLHGEPDLINHTRHSSTYYGSSQQPASIPRHDPARDRHPGSPLFNQLPPAQIRETYFQSHQFDGQTALPPKPMRAAPGENPYGNQKPGTYTSHPRRHGTYHQNRSRGPYPFPIHPRQQGIGHQQANPHSNAQHPWHGVPSWMIPSQTGDHSLVLQAAYPAAVPAQPQGPRINEAQAATMLINSSPADILEAATHMLFPGAQPTGTPILYSEASSNVSQSTIGPCPDPTCNSNQKWGRKQELERHVLRHLPHPICCPHPSCGWMGTRRYALKEHYKKKHPKDEEPDDGAPEAFTIYDAKLLAKRLVNKEITMAAAMDEADELTRKRQGRLDT